MDWLISWFAGRGEGARVDQVVAVFAEWWWLARCSGMHACAHVGRHGACKHLELLKSWIAAHER